ncbi:MAG: hypothetical protein M3Q24_01565 [bacterium]|nr:hypothetical protein [bacterium]
MFKLLTEEQRVKVQKEYSQRRIVVLLVFLCAALSMGVVGLFPAYVVSASKEKDANQRIQILNQTLSGIRAEDLSVRLQDINTKIKLFAAAPSSDRPYEYYKEIISLRSNGIALSELSYRKKDGKAEYSLGGVASDRRALIEFQNNLNNSLFFTNVNVPISDLAKSKDIDFNLTLEAEK